jgi:hypothetical protein
MSADPAVQGTNCTEDEHSADRARALCAEALQICDELGLSPEIGARLQEVITALEKSSKE